MPKNKTRKLNVNKIFSWLGVSLIASSGLLAIGFGIANFVKYGSKNKGPGYSKTLQTKLQFAVLDQNNEDANLNQSQVIANKLAKTISTLNANDVNVEGGISKSDLISDNNTWTTIGNVYLYTERNLQNFNFDFDYNEEGNLTDSELSAKLAKLDLEKLKFYFTVAQTNVYELTNSGKLLNLESANDDNFANSYILNNINSTNSNEEVTLSWVNEKKQMLFSLREKNKSSSENSNWDLSSFQKQFTEVYDWNGSDSLTRTEVVDSNSSVEKQAPKNSYILWRNRNGLINLLQTLSTIGYLNSKSQVLNNASEQRRIESLYKEIEGISDWKKFTDWSANAESSGGYSWIDIMNILFEAQKYDYTVDIANNKKDPLLDLLNTYTLHDGTYNKEYEYLYSWNFTSNTLFSDYFSVIDYNNWFNFFEQDATEAQLKDPEYVKNEYYSNKINTNWFAPTYGPKTVENASNLANNAAINTQFVNYYLLGLINNSVSNVNQVYNQFFKGFIDKTVNQIGINNSSPFIGNNSFNGVIITLSALLLLIGIIVSILYKVPGIVLSLSMFSSFGLSLLMISNFGITFTMSTIFAFIVSLINPLIAFLFANISLKKSINISKLNINNSFKHYLSSYIWMSILTNVTFFIISLVLMFFGTYQLRSFGTTLTVISFTGLIANLGLFVILVSFLYFLILKVKPILMINKNDLKALASIRNVTSFEVNDNLSIANNNLSSKWINKASSTLISSHWWSLFIIGSLVVAGVVGLVILSLFSNTQISSFTPQNEISLLYATSLNDEAWNAINYLQNALNITFVNLVVNENVYMGYNEISFIVSNNVLPKDVFNALATMPNASKEIIAGFSFKTNDVYFSTLILDNAIICLFISLAFVAIFNIFMMNIVNVIPLFIISCVTNLVMIGFIGIVHVTIKINIIDSYLSLFIVNQLLTSALYYWIKTNFKMKEHHSYKEILLYAIEQTRKLFTTITLLCGLFILINTVLILFDGYTNWANYLINIINAITSTLILLLLAPLMFTNFMFIRELYLNKIRHSNKKDSNHKHKEYDKVNEQIIIGINHS